MMQLMLAQRYVKWFIIRYDDDDDDAGQTDHMTLAVFDERFINNTFPWIIINQQYFCFSLIFFLNFLDFYLK